MIEAAAWRGTGYRRPLDRTPSEALKDLLATPRLRFGDITQIDALEILRLAEELIGLVVECRECDGTGEVDDDEPGECDKCGRLRSRCSEDVGECPECDGEGYKTWERGSVWRMRGQEILRTLQVAGLHRVAA